jgi:pyruvate,orthophosphate dikinase
MSTTDHKWIYFFGNGTAEGSKDDKNLLGGKGANLAEMSSLGIPVPAGFTISTEACIHYFENDGAFPEGFEDELDTHLGRVEEAMGAKFGDPENPLLVSVRSGARESMPGMMDTVLNIGLNAESIEGMIAATDNPRLVYDSYRRFVQMYGDVVLDMKPTEKRSVDPFEEVIERHKEELGIKHDTEFTAGQLKALGDEFKRVVGEHTGREFPEDPREQLMTAIRAVFDSWNNDRAIAYRELNRIPHKWGTAVNVQTMVFGNKGDNSGTGVAFTRNPATGKRELYGEFLPNAQGEDVVAGIRTPIPIAKLGEMFPEAAEDLAAICAKLDRHYRDMQDVEFTIQDGKLWMLQTRTGKRTGLAAIGIAVDMVDEGTISKEEALLRVEPNQLNQLLRPVFDEEKHPIDADRIVATGLNAGPGAASGRIVFHASDAEDWAKRGEKVILVRIETSPEDIRGMNAAEGILTARGGMTSHAALVARQMGKTCVVGCGALDIDYPAATMTVGAKVFNEGDYISINGTTGQVIEGALPTRPSEVIRVLLEGDLDPQESPDYQTYHKLMSWADEIRRLGVRANADQGDQAANAVAFGAEGIGLARTEHMFFGGDRIAHMREMILASDEAGRKKALDALLPIQRADFEGVFRAMDGRPVTIRTLDPPLHEFLPHSEEEMAEVAKLLGKSVEDVKQRAESLHEANPMLGHRGCRLGLSYPETTAMQARAIIEAACNVKREGTEVHPEIMIPLVSHVEELRRQREVVERVADEVLNAEGVELEYHVGTMIELPRAALTADQVAEVADFFSFGTNDLTQTTFGLSRDDAGSFLGEYVASGILDHDPFTSIDVDGVGQLVAMGVEKGRSTNPELIVGICGEHGGDPDSIDFCHKVGLNYVSCSPFRLPIARLAAARARLLND